MAKVVSAVISHVSGWWIDFGLRCSSQSRCKNWYHTFSDAGEDVANPESTESVSSMLTGQGIRASAISLMCLGWNRVPASKGVFVSMFLTVSLLECSRY